jgi:hypothetical protein
MTARELREVYTQDRVLSLARDREGYGPARDQGDTVRSVERRRQCAERHALPEVHTDYRANDAGASDLADQPNTLA